MEDTEGNKRATDKEKGNRPKRDIMIEKPFILHSNNVLIGHVKLTCGTKFLKLAMMLVLLNSW